MKIIPYSHQWITESDIKAVTKALRSDFLTQGPQILAFEKALANHAGTKYAVVVNSGTAALHAAYFACGLTKGDEFITSPLTFAATTNAGLYLQATPVFSDIEKTTGNIDVSLIEKKITKKTKLLVPIHFSGYPADMEGISRLAKKYGLYVIEDASQALGSTYQNIRIGNCTFADMVVLSFHPVKHITTGEGGAILTNNTEFYEKLLIFRTHGITKDSTKFKHIADGEWYHEMQALGYNYRITDFQAALGIAQLKRITRVVKKRRAIAKMYDIAFKDNPYFDIVEEKNGYVSSYHLYPIRLKDSSKINKKELFSELRRKGLGVQVHHIPVYLHPYYQQLGYKKNDYPFSNEFYEREISIPLFPTMTQKEIQYVIKTLQTVLKNYGNINRK
ncbi:UDP-4-amino-4,6-dideoxy-N-acetyl-beta-L-altrosamine transaminase [soil metagenome]